MTPHQLKEGYLSLPAKAKREFVLWAVQREFSDEEVDGLETQQIELVQAALVEGQSSGSVSTATSPGKSVLPIVVLVVFGLIVVIGAGVFLAQKSEESAQETAVVDAVAAQQVQEVAEAKRQAEVAARPSSPTNLEYLNQRVGNEVTLQGVPVQSEVGYLYFHEDPTMGVRVKLISGGVVVYQSTELEKWVTDQQKLEIRGRLIRNAEDDQLEIAVDRQIQVKLVH